MAKTDKNTILKSGVAKIAAAAKKAKTLISRRIIVGSALGLILISGVAALIIIRPDVKIVDVVNSKVGLAPTFDQLKTAVAKDPKNADLQLDYGHAAWEAGKKDTALAAYDAALALDPKLASDRLAGNLVSCFGTAQQAAAYHVITKRKVVGAEAGLRQLVGDKRVVVRANAVAALDKLGKAQKDDWMTLWIADTKEESCDVRRNAVEKLGQFGDKRGLQAIRAAAKKDDEQTAWYQLSCLRGRDEDAEKKILARR